MTTHYDVLGVRPSAAGEVIKRAYYRKARAFHPDAHSGSSGAVVDEAQRAMALLNAAWNVLRHPELRAEYDQALATEQAAAADVARARRGGNGGAAGDGPSPASALVGHGFRYWFGALSIYRRPGDDGPRLALAVDGATDLSTLRGLAPAGLWALHAQGAPLDDAQLVHLQGLEGLQVLDLSGTRVTDAGLVHLQQLGTLDTLLLWDTAVTDAGLALVARLPSLRILGLGNTAVADAGLAHLRQLAGLRVLQLAGTAVTGRGLEHLHGLVDLDIVSLPWRVRGRHRRRLKAALPRTLLA